MATREERDILAARKTQIKLINSARKKNVFKTPYQLPTERDALMELGRELVIWAETNDVFTLDEFFNNKKYSTNAFLRICRKDLELRSYLDIALSLISIRLDAVVKNNPLYVIGKLKQYSALSREESELKQEADNQDNVQKIYIEEKIGIPVFSTKSPPPKAGKTKK